MTETAGSRPADVALLTALGASIVLATFGYVLLGPFLPEVAGDLETTVPLLGQVVAARLLLAAALGLVAGPLADAFGHRRVMAVGLVAAGLTLVGIGAAPTYLALAATALPGAVAGATLTGLSLAVAGGAFAGAARRSALGWIIGAQALSSVVGVPVLVVVGGLAGWRPVFLGTGIVALAAIPLILRPLPRSPVAPGGAARPLRVGAIVDAYRPLVRHRPTVRLFAATGARAIAWGGLVTYFGAFFKEELRLPDAWVAFGFFLAGGAFIVGSVAAGGRLAFVPPRSLSAGGDLATGLLICLLFAAPLPAWGGVAVATATAFTGAFAYVGVTTLLAGSVPGGAGTTMTLNGALFNLGSAAGGALGGVLLAAGGYTSLGLGLPVFMLVASGVVWRTQLPVPAKEEVPAPEEQTLPSHSPS